MHVTYISVVIAFSDLTFFPGGEQTKFLLSFATSSKLNKYGMVKLQSSSVISPHRLDSMTLINLIFVHVGRRIPVPKFRQNFFFADTKVSRQRIVFLFTTPTRCQFYKSLSLVSHQFEMRDGSFTSQILHFFLRIRKLKTYSKSYACFNIKYLLYLQSHAFSSLDFSKLSN